jgi:hypothetical protein
MKIDPRFLLALLGSASLSAAPLTKSTAVHSRPETSAPTITVLNVGSELPPSATPATPPPAGWTALELSGPHEVYVLNKDTTKSMDVRPGAAFHISPKADSPVLTTMEAGDSAELTGVHQGKWLQVHLKKKVTGYVNIASASPAASTANTAASSSAAKSASANLSPTPAPFAPAPAAPAAYTSGGTGRPAQMVNLGDGGSAALPRLFEGKVVSTRRLFTPRRPYDYQLNDSSGQRYAYLDLSRLLQTEQLDKYIEHQVAVYGTAKPVPDTKDIVIEVESLQLR